MIVIIFEIVLESTLEEEGSMGKRKNGLDIEERCNQWPNQKINIIVTSSLLARRNSDSRPQKIVESIADFARVRVQA